MNQNCSGLYVTCKCHMWQSICDMSCACHLWMSCRWLSQFTCKLTRHNHMWMSHVTCECVTGCHMWLVHVTCACHMSHVTHTSYMWHVRVKCYIIINAPFLFIGFLKKSLIWKVFMYSLKRWKEYTNKDSHYVLYQ